jgi:gliding motility-associatede transport system auxiliary component
MANATTDPTPTPFTNWQAANRGPIGYVLLAIGIAFLGLAILFGVKAFGSAAEAPKEEKKKDEKIEVIEREKKDEKIETRLTRGEYFPPLVWAGGIALFTLALAGWQMNRDTAPAEEPHNARKLILLFGGTFGFLTALLGLGLLYQWRESILKWVNEGQLHEARWMLLALTTLFVGLVVMFLSLQPARAEERSSPVLRRLLYGYNSVLVGLLLFLVLAAGNAIAGMKLPTTLDTTAAQFYKLDDTSKQFLADLRQPVHAYLILPRDDPRLFGDMKAFLTNCEDASPFFHAEYLSPGLDRDKVRQLMRRLKVPETQRDQFGLVLAVGEHEEQVSFVPDNEFLDREFDEAAGGRVPTFQAEAKVMTELSYLAEGKQAPVVYFTQGNGELDISGSPAVRERTAMLLREYLTQRKFEVKPLKIEAGEKPKLDDAAAVVILGPNQPLPKATVDVLRDYLQPDKLGQKTGGKLLALLPPFPDKNGTDVAPTGLEELFGRFDVHLEPEFLVTDPRDTEMPALVEMVAPPALAASHSPFARAVLAPQAEGLLLFESLNARPVRAGALTQGRSPLSWESLLVTLGRSFVWHEKNLAVDEIEVFKSMVQNTEAAKKLRAEKQLAKQRVPIAVLGAEGGAPLNTDPQSGVRPRFVVFGTASFVSDDLLRLSQRFNRDANLGLFTACLDWLRERPSNIGIKPRKYEFYRLEKDTSVARLYWTPVLLVCLGIVALGTGVWVVRRQ